MVERAYSKSEIDTDRVIETYVNSEEFDRSEAGKAVIRVLEKAGIKERQIRLVEAQILDRLEQRYQRKSYSLEHLEMCIDEILKEFEGINGQVFISVFAAQVSEKVQRHC